MAVHELRDKARLGIAYAQAGTPVMIFQHGDPAAVLIAGDEVARWLAIEGSFSALHGLDVYPELADDTSSLGSLLAGGERPSGAAARRLARERRQILEIPRTIGITEIRDHSGAVARKIIRTGETEEIPLPTELRPVSATASEWEAA